MKKNLKSLFGGDFRQVGMVAALAAIISLAGRTARKKSGKKQASAG